MRCDGAVEVLDAGHGHEHGWMWKTWCSRVGKAEGVGT